MDDQQKSINIINVARAAASRSPKIANLLQGLEQVEDALKVNENEATREFLTNQWISQLSQLSTMLAPSNSVASNSEIHSPSLAVATRTFLNPTGIARWQGNGNEQNLVTVNNLQDGNMTDRTKLVADAAVLKNTGNEKKYWTQAMTTQEMLSNYDKIPKLLTNQEPSTLVIPPTLLSQTNYNQSPSMSKLMGPLLGGQMPMENRMARMDTSNQSITPEKPLVRLQTGYQGQNSEQSSTSSTSTQDYAKFNNAQNSMDNGIMDRLSKALPRELMRGVIDYGLGKSDMSTILASAGSNLVNKIIGDDLPTKVIGDDDVSSFGTTSQFTAAAAAVNQSVILDLLARLTMLEQTTKTSITVRPSASWFEGVRTIRQQIVNKNQLYKFQQVYHNYELPGSAFVPTTMRMWEQTPGIYETWPVTAGNRGTTKSITTTGMIQRSVPMLGNVTWQQLRPLMNNTSVAEFASALRIKIRGYDVDAYANLMSNVYSQIEAMSGYSYASKLAKLLAYICASYQFPRKEESAVGGVGFVSSYRTQAVLWPTADQRLFPIEFAPAAIDTTVGVCSATTFIDIATGRLNPGTTTNRVYNPSYWGSEVSVCMLLRGEMMNGYTTTSRWLQECAFPAMILNRSTLQSNLSSTNVLHETITVNVTPRILGGTIRGPTYGVLFVIIDDETTLPPATDIEFLNNTVTNCGYPNVKTLSNTTAADGLRAYFNQGSAIPYLMAEISRWEQIYGNNSDRSSAMRWCAEQTVAFNGHGKVTISDSALINNVLSGIWNAARPQQGDNDNYLNTSYPTRFNFGGNVEAVRRDAVGRTNLLWTTPLRQTRGLVQYTAVQTTVGQASSDVIVSNYLLGHSHPAIDFLCNRGWLRPSEEYPATRLYDPWQIVLTINEMAEIMGTLSDIVAEVHSAQHHEFTLPYSSFPDNVQNYVQHHMKNVIWPSIRMITNTGPQFPGFILNTEAFDTNVKNMGNNIALNANVVGIDENLAFIRWISPSRIPFQVRAQFSDYFLVNSPLLNFGDLGSHQTWMPNPYNADLRTLYYAVGNIKGDKKRLQEISKLSMAVSGTNEKNINGLIMVGAVTRNSRIPVWCVIQPGQWTAFAVAYIDSSNDQTIATNIAFPIGCLLPTTDVFLGGDQIYYGMRGPRELFTKGSNTMSVYLYINNSSISSMISAPITNLFDQSEFKIDDPMNSTVAFL